MYIPVSHHFISIVFHPVQIISKHLHNSKTFKFSWKKQLQQANHVIIQLKSFQCWFSSVKWL